MSTASLSYRALAALPQPLQQLAWQHVQLHRADQLGELVSELAIAAIELADADAQQIFNRARSRLRRQTQDIAYYAAALDVERQDVAEDEEDEGEKPHFREEIVREIAQRHRVTLRRAQQIVRRQIERARAGDLFLGWWHEYTR
jgi:hypothetical protein